MPNDLLSRYARRVAAVSAATVIVIAGAGALSIWRYQVALSQASVALDERTDARTAVDLTTTFWEERNASRHLPRPPGTGDVRCRGQVPRSVQAPSRRAADPLHARRGYGAGEAVAAQARYYAVFLSLRPAAGNGGIRAFPAITGSRRPRPAWCRR